MSEVFISYSRQNKVFAERLFNKLEADGRDSWVDWGDIPPSSNWWREVREGIETAENFIFIISPDSMISPVCILELTHAASCNKRIVPIVYIDAQPETALGKIAGIKPDSILTEMLGERDLLVLARDSLMLLMHTNWIFFRDSDDFDSAYIRLVETIETDLTHVKTHTRLLIRGIEWSNSREHDSSLLLRGSDLREAENWLTYNRDKKPQPTALHQAFIDASVHLRVQEEQQERIQRQRLRNLVVLLSILLVAAVAAGLLAFERNQEAQIAQQEALSNASTSVANAASATIAQGQAQQNAATSAANAATATVAQGQAINNASTSVANAASATVAQGQAQQNAATSAANAATATVAQGQALNNASTSVANAASATIAQGQAQQNAATSAANANLAATNAEDAIMQSTLAANNASTSVANAASATIAQGQAQQSAATSAANAGTAIAARATSDANLRTAWTTQSIFLANLSRQQLAAGAPQTALQLALQSLDHYSDGIYNQISYDSLYAAMTSPVQEVFFAQHNAPIGWVYWNQDKTRFLSYSTDGTVSIWEPPSQQAVLTLHHNSPVTVASWHQAKNQVLTATKDGTITLWDGLTGNAMLVVHHQGSARVSGWNRAGTQFLTYGNDGSARLWDAQTGAQQLILRHAAVVDSARWSSDSKQLYTWDKDGTVHIWDAITGQELMTFIHTKGRNVSALWNSDETKLLTWDYLGATSKVWDMTSGELLFTLQQNGWVGGGNWSKDGSQIMTWSSDYSTICQRDNTCINRIHIWDAETGSERIRMSHDGPINSASWNADETQILSDAQDGTTRVWNARTGAEVLRLAHVELFVGSSRWDSTETHIMTVNGSGVYIWDAITGEQQHILLHTGPVQSAAWGATSNEILSWSKDGSLHLWELQGGEIFPTVHHAGGVSSAQWLDDGRKVLSYSYSSATMDVWDASSGRILQQLTGASSIRLSRDQKRILGWQTKPDKCSTDCVTTITIWQVDTGEILSSIRVEENLYYVLWSEDESSVIGYTSDGRFSIWNAQDGSLISQFDAGLNNVRSTSADFSSDKRQAVMYSFGVGSREANIWDLETGTKLRTLQSDTPIDSCDWNSDGSRILTYNLNEDHSIRIWDSRTGAQLLLLPHDAKVYGAIWNTDDSQVMSWMQSGTVYVWDAQTGEKLLTLPDAGINGGRWNKDETQIMTLDGTGGLSVWDAKSGELLLKVKPNDQKFIGTISSADWNADGTQIIAVHYDNDTSDRIGGVIRIWDVKTGQIVSTFYRYADYAGARWSADGKKLLVWDASGEVQIIPLDLETMIISAQKRLIRPFSNADRQMFYMPTFEPSPTPIATMTIAVPTLTPLATLTPSLTPMPTLIPSQAAAQADLPFQQIIPQEILGLRLVTTSIIIPTQVYDANVAKILAPGDTALVMKYVDASGDLVVYIHESVSPYETLEDWLQAVGYSSTLIINSSDVSVATVFLKNGNKIFAFELNGVFVTVWGNPMVDIEMMSTVVKSLVAQ